jgi:hypothetical protein
MSINKLKNNNKSLSPVSDVIKKYWHWFAVVLLAIVFFFSASSFVFLTQVDDFVKWSSPDATANYVFAKLYGQTGEINIFEKFNLEADDVIHPRSMRSDHGFVKPVSFLGIIIIYGKIVSLTSYKIIPFLTPIIASLGLIFYFLFIQKIFGKKNAIMSTFVLASFPVYLYYSSRSMFHNVLFMSLLIIGFYYCLLMVKSKRKYLPLLHSALAGFFIGGAIITRTSELIWLAPILLIAWFFNIRKVSISKLIIFLSFLFISLLPIMSWNQILNGSFFSFGYPEINQSIYEIKETTSEIISNTAIGELAYHKELFENIKSNIFHFGVHPKDSLKKFYYYFIDMFPWLFWTSFFGLFLFLQDIKKWKRKHWVYVINFLILSIILVLYYGSWEFYDNPDRSQVTIGNSYTRYWLPIYLGAIPFLSLFLNRFLKALFSKKKLVQQDILSPKTKNIFSKINNKYVINSIIIIFIVMVSVYSINFVLFGSEEGLVYTYYKNTATRQEYREVMSFTESNSVIITRYHDKLFFPERKVIVGLFDDDRMNEGYAKLVNLLPVYYYNFSFREADIDYLNNSKFKNINLRIEKVKKVNKDFSLYRLVGSF